MCDGMAVEQLDPGILPALLGSPVALSSEFRKAESPERKGRRKEQS